MKDKLILVSVAVVFREIDRQIMWFVVKQTENGGWEFPKTVVRKVESSVRASIRNMAEQGATNAKVWEEVGRSGGATKVNGRPVAQRFIYYFMEYLDAGEEVLSFLEAEWMPYAKANKVLESKRDKMMLASGRAIYKELKKKGSFIKEEIVEEEKEEEKKGQKKAA